MIRPLQLLRGDGARRPGAVRWNARRSGRRRVLDRFVRAVEYGLSLPDSRPARQARLLADVFGPQLELFRRDDSE